MANIYDNDAALDSIFGTQQSSASTQTALMDEARAALSDNGQNSKITLRMATNAYDCYPMQLTAERLMQALNSPLTASRVTAIREGNDKLKIQLPCIFWQGTLDIRRYAEANRHTIEVGEPLPKAVNKDKYFTLATPFCFIDFDQPHEAEAKLFDPLILFGKVQHNCPQDEVVFAQATARKGLRLVVKRNDTESLADIQQRYAAYADRPVDELLDYTRRSFLTTMDDVYYIDLDAICQPFTLEAAERWAMLDRNPSVTAEEGIDLEAEAHPTATEAATQAAEVACTVDELMGGKVGEGSRHNRYLRLIGVMRYLCPTAEQLIEACGYEELPLEERMRMATDILGKTPYKQTPKVLQEAISIVREKGETADWSPSGSVIEEEPQLPSKLPKPLQALVKKVHPLLYPTVIRSAFAAFSTHLEGVRIRYENGTENELPFVHLCVAAQGSGKSSIIAPSDVVLREILTQDNENRAREAAWKQAKAMGETGIERPADLSVQVLSSDCTAAAFNQKLADARGRYLYMRMDELEGLKKMAGSVERATEILRLAFDASTYGQERVGAESVTTRCTLRLNLVASTTPLTAQKFFKNATMDGTLTRIGLSTINNPDKVRWHYGTYDERYHAELAPYISRLRTASGLITCPQAEKLIRQLVDEAEDNLSVNGQQHLMDYVYRSGIIAFREAMLLYIMLGKWTKEIANYMAWSLNYQLWVMERVFGRTIRLAYEAAQEAERNVPIVKNLLVDLPSDFTSEQLKRHFIALGKKSSTISTYLRQQVHRKNLRREGDRYFKTERFKQRYEQ